MQELPLIWRDLMLMKLAQLRHGFSSLLPPLLGNYPLASIAGKIDKSKRSMQAWREDPLYWYGLGKWAGSVPRCCFHDTSSSHDRRQG